MIMKLRVRGEEAEVEIMKRRHLGATGQVDSPKRWLMVPVLAKESMDSVCATVIRTFFVLLLPSKPMSCWHLKD